MLVANLAVHTLSNVSTLGAWIFQDQGQVGWYRFRSGTDELDPRTVLVIVLFIMSGWSIGVTLMTAGWPSARRANNRGLPPAVAGALREAASTKPSRWRNATRKAIWPRCYPLA